jgi:hypothetical protein
VNMISSIASRTLLPASKTKIQLQQQSSLYSALSRVKNPSHDVQILLKFLVTAKGKK